MATDRQNADILPFGPPKDYPAQPRHVTVRPSLLDRIADALGSERGFLFFLGWTTGLLFAGIVLAMWGAK